MEYLIWAGLLALLASPLLIEGIDMFVAGFVVLCVFAFLLVQFA